MHLTSTLFSHKTFFSAYFLLVTPPLKFTSACLKLAALSFLNQKHGFLMARLPKKIKCECVEVMNSVPNFDMTLTALYKLRGSVLISTLLKKDRLVQGDSHLAQVSTIFKSLFVKQNLKNEKWHSFELTLGLPKTHK